MGWQARICCIGTDCGPHGAIGQKVTIEFGDSSSGKTFSETHILALSDVGIMKQWNDLVGNIKDRLKDMTKNDNNYGKIADNVGRIIT